MKEKADKVVGFKGLFLNLYKDIKGVKPAGGIQEEEKERNDVDAVRDSELESVLGSDYDKYGDLWGNLKTNFQLQLFVLKWLRLGFIVRTYFKLQIFKNLTYFLSS